MKIFRFFHRELVLGGAIVYVCLLMWIYPNFVAPIYKYQGMRAETFPWIILLMQVLVSCVPAAWLPLRISKPSQFQIWVLYSIVFVPANVVGYHIVSPDAVVGYGLFMVVITICFFLLSTVSYLPRIRIPLLEINPRFFGLFLGFLILVSCIALYIYLGPPELFQYDQVYAERALFKKRIAEIPSVVRYLYWMLGTVFSPFLIIFGLQKRMKVALIAGLSIQVYLFLLTTLRTFVVVVVFLFGVWMLIKLAKEWRGLIFLYGIICFTAISGFCLMAGYRPSFSLIFLQRLILSNGQLTGGYYDYFHRNPQAHYGDSILRNHVDYPYQSLSPSQVVGREYFSDKKSAVIPNATANIWADGYANLGYLGLFFVTGVAFILLWMADIVFSVYDEDIAVFIFSAVSMSFTGQGVQTSLLTGGMIPLFVIAWLGHRAFSISHSKP